MISNSLSAAVSPPIALDDLSSESRVGDSLELYEREKWKRGFFLAELEFYGIVKGILDKLYVKKEPQLGPAGEIAIVLHFDDMLLWWNQNLPEALGNPPANPPGDRCHRLAWINWIR